MCEFQNTHKSVRSKYTYSVHAVRNPMANKFIKAELTETEKSLNQNVSVILVNPKVRLFYETYEPLWNLIWASMKTRSQLKDGDFWQLTI